MSSPSERSPDRRRHARIEPKGTVTIHALGNAHRGRLANIGRGGMYVATEIGLPHRLLGRTVELELRFDGALAAWQHLSGRISRIGADGVALVFEQPAAPLLLDMIDMLTTASHAHARRISVVLIDSDDARRSALAGGFLAAGCDVVTVGTPLEAIVRLGESHFEPDVIAVTSTQPAGAANEMRAFVRHHHRGAMLISIGPDVLKPLSDVHWLSEATGAADLPSRIRELLFAPRYRADEHRTG